MNRMTRFSSRPVALIFPAALAWVQPVLAQDAAAAHDGGITMAQFVARQTDRVMALDTDGDGRISRAEMAAVSGRDGTDPNRRFDAMDSNHNGYIDKDEIRAALEKRFHRMDRNGDGVLTPDEQMAGRAQHPQAPPPGMSPLAHP